MDSAELEEISHHRANGRPETTRGPYYHKAWWESYKGAVKGILGGLVVGGIVGAAIGGTVIGILAVAGASWLSPGVAGGIMAAATVFGMIEGKEKFEKVGITTGAVAAAAEIAELREKTYMRERFAALTNEIREFKAALTGKLKPEEMRTDPAQPDMTPIFKDEDFKSTHCEECPTKSGLYFGRVGAIGALVGAAVGALLGIADPAAHVLGEVLGMSTLEAVAGGAATILATTGAVVGASFGINRDIFRQIFDVTDCWFMGIVDAPCNGKTPYTITHEKKTDVSSRPVQSNKNEFPTLPEMAEKSPTHFRDKVTAAAAKQALLSMDHTTAIRH